MCVPRPTPSPHAFEFHFFIHKPSKPSSCWRVLPAKGCCVHQALSPGWAEGVFLVPRTDGGCSWALTSHSSEATLRENQSFFWGVAGCLLQSGSLLRALRSSVPLVASECWCKVCRSVHPGPGMRAELGRGGKWILSGALPLQPRVRGKHPTQGAQVCLWETEHVEVVHRALMLMLALFFCLLFLFFFFATHQRCLQSDFFFFNSFILT